MRKRLQPEWAFTFAGISIGCMLIIPMQHAGVAAWAQEHQRLKSLTPNGDIRYQLKTPYQDSATHVILEPLNFIARVAALVPKPRVSLMRFHNVLPYCLRFSSKNSDVLAVDYRGQTTAFQFKGSVFRGEEIALLFQLHNALP